MNGDQIDQRSEEDFPKWEPRNAHLWRKSDPLLMALDQNKIHVPNVETDARSFYEAWRRLPTNLRAQVIREREIAAAIVRFLPSLRERIAGLYSVGVGMRGREPELTAVITVGQHQGSSEWTHVRKIWQQEYIPKESIVPDYAHVSQVPILIEYRSAPTLLGKVPEGGFLVGEPDPTPADAPIIQSGDEIGSETPSGICEFGTLSCIVHKPNSTSPLLLSSGHVFMKEKYRVLSRRTTTLVQIGEVTQIQQSIDAALATLSPPYLCDFRVQGSDLVPAAPVIATSNLAVQIYGAKSKHQLGHINLAADIPANATVAGVFPQFTTDIPTVHGDSGALLISGQGADSAIPKWQRPFMAPVYVDSLKSAILGVLKAGSTSGADPTLRAQSYFVPVLQILNDLGVEAWVR